MAAPARSGHDAAGHPDAYRPEGGDRADHGEPDPRTRLSAFSFAVERDWIDANPAFRIAKPADEKSRDRVLSRDELRELWTALHQIEAKDANGRKLPRLSQTLNDAFIVTIEEETKQGDGRPLCESGTPRLCQIFEKSHKLSRSATRKPPREKIPEGQRSCSLSQTRSADAPRRTEGTIRCPSLIFRPSCLAATLSVTRGSVEEEAYAVRRNRYAPCTRRIC